MEGIKRRKAVRAVMLFPLLGLCKLTVAQLSTPASYSKPEKVNYVRTWDAVKPVTDASLVTPSALPKDFKMATQYLDGLGRPIQNVLKQASLVTDPEDPVSSANAVDMVSTVLYDNLGREVNQYLPFAANATGGNTHVSDGLFKLNPFQQQVTFYNSQLNGQTGEFNVGVNNLNWAYTQSVFEASPLHRPAESFAPGSSWVGSAGEVSENNRRSIKLKYWANTTADSVRIWQVTDVANSWGVYTTPGVYPTGMLMKTITIDEHGKQVVEFKSGSGKVLLKKVQLNDWATDNGGGTGHTGWLCTYYIYDDLNRLRAVIQPRGVAFLDGDNWADASVVLIQDEQFFRYEYDGLHRMIMKKVPGAGEVYMVYDARDRLVMTQDANMRAKSPSEWMVTGYDALNRPTHTGIFKNNFSIDGTPNRTLTQHLTAATASTGYPFAPATPPSATYWELLTQTFYDNYDWVSEYGNMFSIYRSTEHDAHFLTPSNENWPYPQAMTQSFATKGMVTGTYIKVLGTASHYLWSINYYDNKGRTIQTSSYNITGWANHVTTQYDFTGKVLRQHVATPKNFATPRNDYQLTKYEYDELGRLITTKKTLLTYTNATWHEGPEKIIAKQEYDALGQLKKKVLAPEYNDEEGLETLDYAYNIRGWLLGVNKDYMRNTEDLAYKNAYFGFELGYDKPSNSSDMEFYHARQYNGNISGMLWKSAGDEVRRKYDFRYDAANRLGTADFTQNTNKASGGTFSNTEMDFSVFSDNPANDYFIRYDLNGNILNMVQRGFRLGHAANDPIDKLKYTYYEGTNRLKSVVDFKNDPATKLGDFRTTESHDEWSTKSGLTASSTSLDFNGITDYDYDANGNLEFDKNKGISSITYNHLNLPQTITVAGKGTITYTYDAAGNKLKKTTLEEDATVNGELTDITTTTTYIDGSVYESKVYSNGTVNTAIGYTDKLQFIGMEEGRIRFRETDNSFQYDYMLKDHLGNVRMVLTEEEKVNQYYAATMEDATIAMERELYSNLDGGVRIEKPEFYPTDPYDDPNGYVASVNGAGRKMGPGITLKVMAGDKFDVRVSSWYKTNVTNPDPSVSSLEDLVYMLSNTVAPVSGGKATVSQLINPGFLSPGMTDFFNDKYDDYIPSRPKAYLNWVLLDEQFKYVEESSGAIQVGENNILTVLGEDEPGLPITKNGYLYIYVSNETPNIDVFFDNLQVTHHSGPILEETHYYPFGLTMAGISSKALNGISENKLKYNGIEHNGDFGINMYDAFYRTLDPQIGRFWQIDPKPNENFSSYAAMANNPIFYSDPFGDTTWVYGSNGNFLGVINDNLSNQIHFLGSEGGSKPFDASDLNLDDAINMAKGFRDVSVAFMGSNTMSDMKSIKDAAVKDNEEILFIGIVGKDKEIRLSSVKTENGEYAKIADVDKIFDSKYSKEEQSKLFLMGHVHQQKPSTSGLIQTSVGDPLYHYGHPSNPTSNSSGDYGPYLYRSVNATQRGQSPALILSRWGFTVYGTATESSPNPYGGYNVKGEVRPGLESYYLYKQLKK